MNSQGINNIKYHIYMLHVCCLFMLILVKNTPFFRAVRCHWVMTIIRSFPNLYGPSKLSLHCKLLISNFYVIVKTCFMRNPVNNLFGEWKRNNTKSCKKLFKIIIFKSFNTLDIQYFSMCITNSLIN